MVNNRPSQLERIRKEHYDELYERQPKLMKKLNPFFDKVEIIQNNGEPKLTSPNDPLNPKLKEPMLKNMVREKSTTNISLKNEPQKPIIKRKVSGIKPNLIWALK